LAKGRALARPSERSERFEPVVRPDWPDTVVAATQKEKADAADAAGVLSKLFAVVQNTQSTPFDDANDGTYYRRRGVAMNRRCCVHFWPRGISK